MAVSISEVVNAYVHILGREPESFEVIEKHLDVDSVATLRMLFSASEENLINRGIIPVGRHMEYTENLVDMAATPDQLSQMLKRVAAGWSNLGASEPHWSVLTLQEYKSTSIRDTEEQFFATGHGDIARVRAMLRRNGLDFPRGLALDFGSGVGRLSLALARHVDQVLGADVSEAHLAHAEKRRASTAVGNVSFQSIRKIEDLGTLPACDFILSLIVLQHNPPPIIKVLLASLLQKLQPRGLAVFQVPVFCEGYCFSAKKYLGARPSSDLEMHLLPQPHVFEAIREGRAQVIEVREDMWVGDGRWVSQTFLVQKDAA